MEVRYRLLARHNYWCHPDEAWHSLSLVPGAAGAGKVSKTSPPRSFRITADHAKTQPMAVFQIIFVYENPPEKSGQKPAKNCQNRKMPARV
jgi:hypothetical protein